MGGGGAQTGFAGALGSGLSSTPLAEGASFVAAPNGALGWQMPTSFAQSGGLSSGMAGELGSGFSGVTMPTASEITPWYRAAWNAAKPTIDGVNKGVENVGKVNTAMKAFMPQQQGGAVMMDSGPMFSGQRQQISPYSQPQSRGNNLVLMLEEQRRRGLLG